MYSPWLPSKNLCFLISDAKHIVLASNDFLTAQLSHGLPLHALARAGPRREGAKGELYELTYFIVRQGRLAYIFTEKVSDVTFCVPFLVPMMRVQVQISLLKSVSKSEELSTILQCFNEGASSEIAFPRFFKDNIYLELPRFVK